MPSIIDTLITDRTQEDVDALIDLLASGVNPSSNHKGAYNASDLNRVGEACNFLLYELLDIGIDVAPVNLNEIYGYNTAKGLIVNFKPIKPAPIHFAVDIVPTQSGSGTPSASNVRPITGWDSVKIWRTSKNYFPQSDVSFSKHDGNKTVKFSHPLSAGVYTFSANLTSTYTAGGCLLHLIKKDNTYQQFSLAQGGRVQATFESTESNPIVSVRFYIGNNYSTSYNNSGSWNNIQVESGVTATEYIPCDVIIDKNLPDTVYGGTVDLSEGTLTVTHKSIASYAGEILPGEWISDMDVYRPGGSPSTGAHVVYALDEPVIHYIDPEITIALYGENIMWANSGESTVKYLASITKEMNIEKAAKTDWNIYDIPTMRMMQDYLNKISNIFAAIIDYRQDRKLPTTMRKFDYIGANQIEAMLQETDILVTRIKLSYRSYSGRQISGVNCLP